MLSAKHEVVMSMPERVSTFLNAQRPNRFCDDCIAKSLEFGGKQKVPKASIVLAAEASIVLATMDSFHRALGICSMCGKEKTVIQRA